MDKTRFKGRHSIPQPILRTLLGLTVFALASGSARAQLTNQTQTPNRENSCINLSLADQIGAGQGSDTMVGSSMYLIKRDPFRSIRRGRQLFQRKFTMEQGNGPRSGDGVGSIEADASIGAGLSDSCASCHGRPRGAAGFGGDVFTRPDSRDSPHLFGLGLQEMLADEITRDLRAIRDAAVLEARRLTRPVTKSLVSKSIEYGRITAKPDGTVDTTDVEGVNRDLRVRPFLAQGGTISIREFVVGALNAEMGLESFDPLLASAATGARVTTPAGMVLDGATDALEAPPVASASEDRDGDGVTNEIDAALIDHLEFYLLNYFKPATYFVEKAPAAPKGPRSAPGPLEREGIKHMTQMGCTSCHVQSLVIEHDRRVADVETVFDPVNGIFNELFATATPRFNVIEDGQPETLKLPSGETFVVRNFFADLKRHDLGPHFWELNFDGSFQKEFMTEPLWGVGSTPPYGHDGRSINLRSVILRHGGEAEPARDKFAHASASDQAELMDYLNGLVLFPPDDTASNLNPGERTDPDFPQRGHGYIALTHLFNDPSKLE